jgi:hypothetical protein
MCGTHGDMRNAYKVLITKPQGKRALGRPRCKWKDITTNLRGTGCEGVEWTQLVQDKVVADFCENLDD